MEADPDVTVDAGSGPTRHRAHAAIGDEADRLWPRVISVYPGYADYQARTERPISLFVLEPVGDA
jgi:deazaflavin-dependent oxidoreductase (nitroreductase family)